MNRRDGTFQLWYVKQYGWRCCRHVEGSVSYDGTHGVCVQTLDQCSMHDHRLRVTCSSAAAVSAIITHAWFSIFGLYICMVGDVLDKTLVKRLAYTDVILQQNTTAAKSSLSPTAFQKSIYVTESSNNCIPRPWYLLLCASSNPNIRQTQNWSVQKPSREL